MAKRVLLRKTNGDGEYLAGNGSGAARVEPNRLLAVAQIGTDQTATYANSAAANTQVIISVTKATYPAQRHQIVIYNPSTVTDLTVKIFGKCLVLGDSVVDIDGTTTTTKSSLYDSFTVPKKQSITGTTINTYVKEIEGIFADTDLRIVVSNDTVLGASDGFSAYVRVKSV